MSNDHNLNYAVHSFWIISKEELLYLSNLEPYRIVQDRLMKMFNKDDWDSVAPIESLLYKGMISYHQGVIELNDFLHYLLSQLSSSFDEAFEFNCLIECNQCKVLIQDYPYQLECTKIAILPKERVHESVY